MKYLMRRLRALALRISPDEVRLDRRGFPPCGPSVRVHLERIGTVFLDGYHAALEACDLGDLAARLKNLPAEFRGFGYEGAAMGLAMLDRLTPWTPGRLAAFLDGTGSRHDYLAHVGAGWSVAALRLPAESRPRGIDRRLRWLVVDGYGFYQGYFRPHRSIGARAVPRRLSAYGRRAFDQGLGRSLWFAGAADPSRIARTIDAFPASRRGDLWSGVGLACAYAGGIGRDGVESLRTASAVFSPDVAQGAAFAAEARDRAGIPADWTDLACRVFCGMPAGPSAALVRAARVDLPPDDESTPSYDAWRLRTREHWTTPIVRAATDSRPMAEAVGPGGGVR